MFLANNDNTLGVIPVRIADMDSIVIERACKLFQTSPDQLVSLSGGHSNAVYRYPLARASRPKTTRRQVTSGVLRVGVEDCPTEHTLGMLEWVRFLSEHGAPVTAPLSSVQGHLLEKLVHSGKTYNVTAFEEAVGTLAERIPPSEWTEELFISVGRAAGKLHAISKQYHPSRPELTRPQWFDGYEIQEANEKLAYQSDSAGEKLGSLIQQLKYLPTGAENFGLIHADLHYANFLIQADGRVTIIDFDDCVYGWFSMDVGMALFDVLVLFNAPSEELSQEFARRFMRPYLTGYRQANELPLYWQEQIPHFLKLKEICVYAPLIGHPDIQLPDSWVGRFMRGRAERIANDTPYVELDFRDL